MQPLDAVRQFFDDAEWSHEVDESTLTVRAFHEGDTGTFPVYVRVDDEREQVVVYAVLSDAVDEPMRLAVGAMLAGLNSGLAVSAFDIDYGDGEVRCRAGLSYAGVEPSAPMVRSLAAAAVVGLDTYRPAIEAVADGADPLATLADAGG